MASNIIKTKTLGDVKLFDTFEKTISLMWSYTGKKIKFELSSNCSSWTTELCTCIQFAKVLQGLYYYSKQLQEQFFGRTETKIFYGSKTFGISYVGNKRTIVVKTGLCHVDHYDKNKTSLIDVNYIESFGTQLGKYLDEMILHMQANLPCGVAKTTLEYCQKVAQNLP